MEEAYDRKETLADEEMKDRLMHKEILAYLVSQFVDDFKKMNWREVLPFLEDPHGGDIRRGDRESTVKGHGGVRYDILVRLTSPKRKDKKIGVVLNVEGQNEINSYEAMKKRMLYYPCRLISEQKGDIFTNDHYRDLAEVVSVWLFLRPAKRDQGLVVEWSMTSRKLTPLEGTSPTWEDPLRGLKVVAVCVPDLKHVQSHTVAGMLGVCLDALLPTGERNEMLKKDWDVDLPSSAKEDSSMFEGAGRSLWKEGRQTGRLEGRDEAFLESIRSLSAQLNLSSVQAMNALRIPPKERRRLLAQLDQPEAKEKG